MNASIHTIGFQELLTEIAGMTRRQSFPPFDIEVVDEEKQQFKIVAAVAGFKESDIEITAASNKLMINGSAQRDETKKYQHKGIAKRDFKLEFWLHEFTVVKGAKLENGLLGIDLAIEIPEDKKAKTIPINVTTA